MHWLPGLYALTIDAVAGDRQGAAQIIQMCAIKPYRLLTTPAQPFDPGRVAQDDPLDAFIFFQKDFDLLVFMRGIKNLNRSFIAALHENSPKGKFYLLGFQRHPNGGRK
jgi:hypothetical protein